MLIAMAALVLPDTARADPEFRTFTGADRYETAALIARESHPDRAVTVFLVKGSDYPDALAAAPVAAAYEAPILITPPEGLNASVRAELARLLPDTVFVVGLPDLIETQVAGLVPGVDTRVVRGEDRYHTAALLADELEVVRGTPDRIVLVAGDNFPDALAVGPLAACQGWPILLTPQHGALPGRTEEEIIALNVTRTLRVGTRVALPDGIEVTEIVGLDRYDTNARVAEYGLSFGLGFSHVAVVKGDTFPDALVVGPYLEPSSGTILLTRSSSLPAVVRQTLIVRSTEIETLDLVGLAPSIRSAIKTAAWLPFPVEAGGARQLITAASHGTAAVVQAWECRVDGSWEPVSGLGPLSAFVGRNGVRADKREGDGATPAGVFTLTEAFGNAPDPGTKLKYRVPGVKTYWVSDPFSSYYNTWREYDGDSDFDPAYGERLAGSPTAYRYVLVIDYNRSPVVRGAGSAIFLHVTLGVPTTGCISMAQADVVRLLRWLDPLDQPRIAIE